MADRFYVNWPLVTGTIDLQGPEAHHLAVVCRLRPGDLVCLFNGDGHEYPSRIVTVKGQRVSLEVLSVQSPDRELGYRLEVAAPLPKGDRAQFLIEKLTEMGVTVFIPLRTQRSVVHPREGRLGKLDRSVIEASKQCGRNVLLRVEPLTDWKTYCTRRDLPANRMLAHPEAGIDSWRGGQDTALAVGPEGGFTDEEIAAARDSGWQLVSLGPRILRVETAAFVLAAKAVYCN